MSLPVVTAHLTACYEVSLSLSCCSTCPSSLLYVSISLSRGAPKLAQYHAPHFFLSVSILLQYLSFFIAQCVHLSFTRTPKSAQDQVHAQLPVLPRDTVYAVRTIVLICVLSAVFKLTVMHSILSLACPVARRTHSPQFCGPASMSLTRAKNFSGMVVLPTLCHVTLTLRLKTLRDHARVPTMVLRK